MLRLLRTRAARVGSIAMLPTLMAGLGVACIASGAEPTRSVRIHATQPATRSMVRFGGLVRVRVPASWLELKSEPGVATFSVTLAIGCSAKVYLSSDSAVTELSAQSQLRERLPRAAQPGLPSPGPIKVLAQGPTQTNTRSGWWRIVAPIREPERDSTIFTLYGGALVQLRRGVWVGAAAGVAPTASCPRALPRQGPVIAQVSRVLASFSPGSAYAT
jgi:hypothetical protein